MRMGASYGRMYRLHPFTTERAGMEKVDAALGVLVSVLAIAGGGCRTSSRGRTSHIVRIEWPSNAPFPDRW